MTEGDIDAMLWGGLIAAILWVAMIIFFAPMLAS